MSFSDRIRDLRLAKDLTQSEFAKKLNITTRQYQRYEGGNQYPTVNKTLEIADFLDVSLDYLFGRTDNPKINE